MRFLIEENTTYDEHLKEVPILWECEPDLIGLIL